MANKAPLKTFQIEQMFIEAVEYVDETIDPTFTWVGFPYVYKVQLNVNPIFHGDYQYPVPLDAYNIDVGQWLSTSTNGMATRIKEIVEVVDSATIIVNVEDVNIYNLLNDPDGSGFGLGLDGAGIVFEIDENGLPLIGPVPDFYMPPQMQANLQTRFFYTGEFEFGGGSEYLNNASSGDIRGGAVVYWTEDETTFTDAIDELNRFVLKISPERPKKFSEYTLLINEGSPLINDYSDLSFSAMALTQGTFTNNSGRPIPAGTIIHPTRNLLTTSTVVTPNLIIGDRGNIEFTVNGAVNYSLPLDDTDQSGSYNGLNIVSNTEVNGVWSAITFSATAPLVADINEFVISNTFTGNTSALIIGEDSLTFPEMEIISTNVAGEDIVYSSGIPHYSKIDGIGYTAEINKVALNTYPTTKIVEIDSFIFDNNLNEYSVKAGEFGTPEIFDRNQGVVTVEATFTTASVRNLYGYSGPVTAKVNNAFNSSVVDLANVNYLSEFLGDGISEIVPTEYEETNPKRQSIPNTAQPVIPSGITYAEDFDAGDMDDDAAVVVGGVLKFSKENYSTYQPSGPDLSVRTGTEQFACFKLKTITNNLTLIIDGTFKEAYIKLPGVDTNFDLSNTTNGWFDMKKYSDFAPGSWPGTSVFNNGCLVGHIGNRYDISFGSISTAFSDDNLILIQFVLGDGDSITSLYRENEQGA